MPDPKLQTTAEFKKEWARFLKTRLGQWAAFDGIYTVATAETRDKLLKKCAEKGYSDDKLDQLSKNKFDQLWIVQILPENSPIRD